MKGRSEWNWLPPPDEGIWRHGAAWMRPFAVAAPWITLAILMGLMALADRRFRECCAGTIREAITDVRLAAVKRLLRETEMPIARITAQCGFADENYAKRLFRQKTGQTMREWRRLHAPA